MKTLVARAIAIGLVFQAACSSVDGHFRKTADYRPSKKYTNVDFYMQGLPSKAHREVGYIATQGSSYRDAFDRMQRLAVENSCDAVGNLHEGTEGVGPSAVTRMSASCYIYRK